MNNLRNINLSRRQDNQTLLNMYVEHYYHILSEIEYFNETLNYLEENINILTENNPLLYIQTRQTNNDFLNTMNQRRRFNPSNPTTRNSTSPLLSSPVTSLLFTRNTSTPLTSRNSTTTNTTNTTNATNTTNTNTITPLSRNLNTRGFSLRNQNNDYLSIFNELLFHNILDQENVIVAPSQEEINNSIIVTEFKNLTNKLNNECPITLTKFNDNDIIGQIKYCYHTFNIDSINTWFQNNVKCPVCRYDIRNYPISTNSTSSNAINTNTTNTTSSNARNTTNTTNARNTTLNSFTTEHEEEKEQQTEQLNSNDLRYFYDPSNNVILFETFIQY